MSMTIAPSRSYERLRPDNSVLLLIDHQIGPLWELEFGDLRRNVVSLARAAASLDVPIVITTIATEQWGPIIPELATVAPDALVVERTQVNAWNDSRVRHAVNALSRPKLVVAGSVTEVSVVLCGRAAARAGYEVYAAIDASGQSSHSGIVTLLEAGVIVTSSALVVSEMAGDRSARASPRRPSASFWGAAVWRGRSCAAAASSELPGPHRITSLR